MKILMILKFPQNDEIETNPLLNTVSAKKPFCPRHPVLRKPDLERFTPDKKTNIGSLSINI